MRVAIRVCERKKGKKIKTHPIIFCPKLFLLSLKKGSRMSLYGTVFC